MSAVSRRSSVGPGDNANDPGAPDRAAGIVREFIQQRKR